MTRPDFSKDWGAAAVLAAAVPAGARGVAAMNDTTYPRIVVGARGSLTRPGYAGIVQLVKEPGNLRTIETVAECEHRHRFDRTARECAAVLAGRLR